LPVKAVFLDFGGTLVYRDPEVWEIFIQVCRRRGYELTLEQISRGRAMGDRSHRSEIFPTRELMEQFWIGWFRLILENLGVPDAAGLAGEIYREVREKSRLHVYPDVFGALEDLSSDVRALGIVSNYNCMLESYCIDLGIARFFDFILASDLVRSHKPDAAIFRLAASEAKCRPSECLHVGDSPTADLEGARGAGLKGLLIDRSGSTRIRDSVEDLRRVPGKLRDM